MIEYQLIRSVRRKSIALQVKQGTVTVRAPIYVKESYIKQLVLQKTPWLEAKLLLQKNQLEEQQNNNYLNFQKVSFSENGYLWLYGQTKNITLSFSKTASIEIFADTIKISLLKRYQNTSELQQSKVIKRQVETWFKVQATELLTEKVDRFSRLLHLFPREIKIRQYKARWGSCNNHRQLSFNYLLLMTPEWVIDYVVIHELCHLKHLNHSRQFWLLVEHHFPRFKEAKHWLKIHQNQLSWPKY
jgi:predicted metal-dependent hydrolase